VLDSSVTVRSDICCYLVSMSDSNDVIFWLWLSILDKWCYIYCWRSSLYCIISFISSLISLRACYNSCLSDVADCNSFYNYSFDYSSSLISYCNLTISSYLPLDSYETKANYYLS
jgi:hypothetical protein